MKTTLQVKLGQHLALTPQLQQSIKLLQLSTLELHQEVASMLEQNPFLDAEEETSPEFEPLSVHSSGAEQAAERETEQAGSVAGEEAVGLDTTEFGTTERDDWENGTERDDFDGINEIPSSAGASASHTGEQDTELHERSSLDLSLQAHLREQLHDLRLSPADTTALHILIESLDDDGYLTDTLQEIAAHLVSEPEEQALLIEQLQLARQWLHRMDPLGVGAANLSECLILQLKARVASPVQTLAILVCSQHLELLARRDVKKIMALTGACEDEVKQVQVLVQTLEPKPARRFASVAHHVVTPDVIVRKSGRQWKAFLNPEVMPKLRINDVYAQALRRNSSEGSGAQLNSRLQEARWFVKNITQRFDTILRVSQAIVERQKNFFTHGELAMKPLVLREIADELGLHESTISRVTTAKYMATLLGTFELKYFFGSSLNTQAGGNASSTAVRALIKQMVTAENPDQPLSDNQLSTLLQEQGIEVARRTVAKYREALRIAPANLRKSF